MDAKRGIRQGDPISTLLFVIVMECLNRYLYKMQKDNNFNYHSKCEKLKITNLCFADDLVLLSRGDDWSVKMMMNMFTKFSKATDLKVNPQKCRIYCPWTTELKRNLSKLLNSRKANYHSNI